MNKLIAVTGGTKGIGLALIEKFAAFDFDIVTCSRHKDELYGVKESIEKNFPGTQVLPFVADVSHKIEVNSFGDFILKTGRPVDVLINNAGYFVPGEIHSEQEGVLESMINTNLYSAYYLTRKLVPSMINHHKGHIFNICSVASIMAYPNGGSYAISKFALLGFSKCLREELKKHNIKVTAVLPGATMTASWEGVDVAEDRLMPAKDIAEMVYASYNLSGRSVVEDILIRPQWGDL